MPGIAQGYNAIDRKIFVGEEFHLRAESQAQNSLP